jgi:hypothetical protein
MTGLWVWVACLKKKNKNYFPLTFTYLLLLAIMRTQAFILIAAVLAALVIAGDAQIRFPKYQARPAPKGTLYL